MLWTICHYFCRLERIIDSKDVLLGVSSLKRHGYSLRSVKNWLEKLRADQGVKGLLGQY